MSSYDFDELAAGLFAAPIVLFAIYFSEWIAGKIEDKFRSKSGNKDRDSNRDRIILVFLLLVSVACFGQDTTTNERPMPFVYGEKEARAKIEAYKKTLPPYINLPQKISFGEPAVMRYDIDGSRLISNGEKGLFMETFRGVLKDSALREEIVKALNQPKRVTFNVYDDSGKLKYTIPKSKNETEPVELDNSDFEIKDASNPNEIKAVFKLHRNDKYGNRNPYVRTYKVKDGSIGIDFGDYAEQLNNLTLFAKDFVLAAGFTFRGEDDPDFIDKKTTLKIYKLSRFGIRPNTNICYTDILKSVMDSLSKTTNQYTLLMAESGDYLMNITLDGSKAAKVNIHYPKQTNISISGCENKPAKKL